MANNYDGLDRVIDHWVTYIASNYPAKVSAINTARKATLIGTIKENFTLSSHKLGIQIDGTLNDVDLTDGTRTAAQVATDINTAAIGVTASDDGQGRVKIVSDAVPASGTVSNLEIKAPSAGTDAASVLGFFGGQHDYRTEFRDPGPIGFVRRRRRVMPIPCVWVRGGSFAPTGVHRANRDEAILNVVIRDMAMNADVEASSELVLRHAHTIQEIMHDDADAENVFVYMRTDQLQHEPNVWEMVDDNTGKRYLFAEVEMTVRVRVNAFV